MHSEPPAETAPSTGPGNQSLAVLFGMAAAGRDALTAEGLSPAASTWLLLLGRALYAAGKALQAVAAGGTHLRQQQCLFSRASACTYISRVAAVQHVQ
jgi:hypothetical protein